MVVGLFGLESRARARGPLTNRVTAPRLARPEARAQQVLHVGVAETQLFRVGGSNVLPALGARQERDGRVRGEIGVPGLPRNPDDT